MTRWIVFSLRRVAVRVDGAPTPGWWRQMDSQRRACPGVELMEDLLRCERSWRMESCGTSAPGGASTRPGQLLATHARRTWRGAKGGGHWLHLEVAGPAS
jgi:hypothetical protein